jgi:uncharacterized membrane protein
MLIGAGSQQTGPSRIVDWHAICGGEADNGLTVVSCAARGALRRCQENTSPAKSVIDNSSKKLSAAQRPQGRGPACAESAAGASLTRTQLVGVAIVVCGYAALSYYGESKPGAKGLGAALSIGPVLLVAIWLIWRWTRPWIAGIFAMVATGLFYLHWEFFERNFDVADLIEQCGAYGLVALSFARTLFAGRTPLLTRLSQEMHGTLTPAEVVYTRFATLAWAVFYLLLAAAILVLYFTASLGTWSLFVNVASFALIIAAVLVDFCIRRAFLPHRPRDGLVNMLKRSLIG